MKRKILSFASVLLTAVLLLCSCSGDVGGTSAGEISDYDSVQFIPVDDDPSSTVNESTAEISDVQTESRKPAESYEHKDYSENVTTQGSGFVVSDKMYDFKGNNLVVLNVENKTNKNYTIYIHGQYLDENGEVIKEETKEFRGFEAGWKNNFFFAPGIPFAKFTYKMETKAYTGKCYGSVFSITYSLKRSDGLDLSALASADDKYIENGMSGDPPKHTDYMVDSIALSINHDYETSESIVLKEKVLFLSSQGEVLRAPDVFRLVMDPGDWTGSDANCKGRDYHCYNANNAKLIEHFERGKVVVLISIETAKLWDGSSGIPAYEW